MSSRDLGFRQPRCINLCKMAITEVTDGFGMAKDGLKWILPHAGGVHLYAGCKES